MNSPIIEVLIRSDEIASRVASLATEIIESLDSPEDLVVVPILSGAMQFSTDLLRHLPIGVRVAFVEVRAFEGERTRRELRILNLPQRSDIAGKTVLIVDDIYDSGETLTQIKQSIRRLGATDVSTAVLVRRIVVGKPSLGATEPDFVGFRIVDDRFLIGYGLDLGGRYRNYPHIGALVASSPEIITVDPRIFLAIQ